MRSLTILTVPLLPTVTQALSTCPASATPFSTFCCSGTLLSTLPSGSLSGAGGNPTSIVLPTETLPTGTVPESSFPLSIVTTFPVSLPGPHPTSAYTESGAGPSGVGFSPLPSSQILPIMSGVGSPPAVRRARAVDVHGVEVEERDAQPQGSSPVLPPTSLAPGVTCFGSVQTLTGLSAPDTSPTTVTETGSATGGTTTVVGGASTTGSGTGGAATGSGGSETSVAAATGSGSGGASGTAAGASGSTPSTGAAPQATALGLGAGAWAIGVAAAVLGAAAAL